MESRRNLEETGTNQEKKESLGVSAGHGQTESERGPDRDTTSHVTFDKQK